MLRVAAGQLISSRSTSAVLTVGPVQGSDSLLVVFGHLLEQRLKGFQRLHGLFDLIEDSSVVGLDFRNQLDV